MRRHVARPQRQVEEEMKKEEITKKRKKIDNLIKSEPGLFSKSMYVIAWFSQNMQFEYILFAESAILIQIAYFAKTMRLHTCFSKHVQFLYKLHIL